MDCRASSGILEMSVKISIPVEGSARTSTFADALKVLISVECFHAEAQIAAGTRVNSDARSCSDSL